MLIRDLVCVAVVSHYEDFQFYAGATTNKYLPRQRGRGGCGRRRTSFSLELVTASLSYRIDDFANVINTFLLSLLPFFHFDARLRMRLWYALDFSLLQFEEVEIIEISGFLIWKDTLYPFWKRERKLFCAIIKMYSLCTLDVNRFFGGILYKIYMATTLTHLFLFIIELESCVLRCRWWRRTWKTTSLVDDWLYRHYIILRNVACYCTSCFMLIIIHRIIFLFFFTGD